MLDIDDFIGKSFTTGPDGKLWQLPDQQFVNLYWFRKDWFDSQDLKERFKAKYGYDLGVPVNWSAYEDIADFFTERSEGDRRRSRLRPHGLRQACARPRVAHDRRLAFHGRRRQPGRAEWHPDRRMGHPHGKGSCNPAGASVSRGGETNGPAAVYAIAKWDEWLRKYAPPGAADLDFYQSLPALDAGNVAQQIFWYSAFMAGLVRPKSEGNNTVDDEGNPLWRMAPSPHGPYWHEGQKVGYQDAGSWTLMKSTPVDRRKAAWLYAQFVVSKTVDVKKTHVGLTVIRDSSIRHESFTERAPKLGGWSSSSARPTACAGRRRASMCRTIRSSRRSGGSRSAT